MESLNLSSNPALAERHRLMLEIEGGNDEMEGVAERPEESSEWQASGKEGSVPGRGRGRGIVFSPEGNEAFMVTGREPALVSTPREVGTRPKTVGQSYEQPNTRAASKAGGAPALGTVSAREDSAEDPVAPSPRSQGCLTDRALSPSQASVTSLLSGTSTVSNAARRRGLEWDYSEDLGMQEAIGQGQAAASLSTLEKMAIGSYTEFLRWVEIMLERKMTYMRLQAVTEFYNTTREEPEGRGEGREPVLPPAPQAVSPPFEYFQIHIQTMNI